MFTYLKVHIFQLFKWAKKTLSLAFVYNPAAKITIASTCAEDFFFWYEFYICSVEPAGKNIAPHDLLEPYQINYIRTLIASIEKGEDLLVEKSIKMGATRMTALVFLWYWLYKKNSNMMILTKCTQEMKQIFQYYLEILSLLPSGLIDEKLSALLKYPLAAILKRPENRYLRYVTKPRQAGILKNPANGNVLYIFSGYNRVHAPHSRQFKAIFYDDMAFQRTQKIHWEAFNQRRCVRVGVSCPNGSANYFYQLSQSGMNVYRLHWIQKNQAGKEWYNAQLEGFEAVFVEQYLNINYSVRQIKHKPAKSAAMSVYPQEEAVIKRHKKKNFRHWAAQTVAAEKEIACSKRHKNPEVFDTASAYEEIQQSMAQQLNSAQQTAEHQYLYANKCLCSIKTALQLISELTGIDVQAFVFQPEKEAFYLKLSSISQHFGKIPYEAQVSEGKFNQYWQNS